MSSDDDASVPVADVLAVLRYHGVESFPSHGNPTLTVFARGDVIEVHSLPERVARRMLHYLARKYEVPIHHLFNPQMVLGSNVRPISAARKKTPPAASSDQ